MKFSSLALVAFAGFPLALGGYLGREPGAPPATRTVTVTATDYALESPDTLPAGAVTLRLVNRGKEFHHLWVARLDDGRTLEDLSAALKTPGPLPAWVRDMGGPNAPAPGGESNGTVLLAPGNYVLACLIPSSDGVPHLMKGMVRPLTVVERGTPAPAPSADATMLLHDFSFTLAGPLTAGKRVIAVRNEGAQPHEIELFRLAPGKTAQEVLAWVHQPEGTPPGLPLGGVAPLARGGEAWFEVELEAGRYALICFVPDAKDGKPHFVHGMVQEIEIESAV